MEMAILIFVMLMGKHFFGFAVDKKLLKCAELFCLFALPLPAKISLPRCYLE